MTSNNLPAIIAELRTIVARDPDGFLNPAVVVEAARPETSPLHTYFEWNDSVAAEQRRLQQAGQLVRRMRIHIVRLPQTVRQVGVEVIRLEKPRTVRFAQAPRGGRGANGGYRLVDDIVADEVLSSDMVDTLVSELWAWIKRTQEYLDAVHASGRDEAVLQDVVMTVAEAAQQAWPSLNGGREGDGDADLDGVVAQQ